MQIRFMFWPWNWAVSSFFLSWPCVGIQGVYSLYELWKWEDICWHPNPSSCTSCTSSGCLSWKLARPEVPGYLFVEQSEWNCWSHNLEHIEKQTVLQAAGIELEAVFLKGCISCMQNILASDQDSSCVTAARKRRIYNFSITLKQQNKIAHHLNWCPAAVCGGGQWLQNYPASESKQFPDCHSAPEDTACAWGCISWSVECSVADCWSPWDSQLWWLVIFSSVLCDWKAFECEAELWWLM